MPDVTEGEERPLPARAVLVSAPFSLLADKARDEGFNLSLAGVTEPPKKIKESKRRKGAQWMNGAQPDYVAAAFGGILSPAHGFAGFEKLTSDDVPERPHHIDPCATYGHPHKEWQTSAMSLADKERVRQLRHCVWTAAHILSPVPHLARAV